MSGEITFRKDCEECGRSFLSPDRTTKVLSAMCRQGSQKASTGDCHQKWALAKSIGKNKKIHCKRPNLRTG